MVRTKEDLVKASLMIANSDHTPSARIGHWILVLAWNILNKEFSLSVMYSLRSYARAFYSTSSETAWKSIAHSEGSLLISLPLTPLFEVRGLLKMVR
jgi:hypothetical protein